MKGPKLSELRAQLAGYEARLSKREIDLRVAQLERDFPNDDGPIGTRNRKRCLDAVGDLEQLLQQSAPYGIRWTPKNRPATETLAAAWLVLAIRTFYGGAS